MFANYKSFKQRQFVSENLALDKDSLTDENTLNLIQEHNARCLNEKEKYPTTLCRLSKTLREFILDDFTNLKDG